MATGNIWDDYRQFAGTGGWTPPADIVGQPTPTVTPGNKAWQDANGGANPVPSPTPAPTTQDPASAAQSSGAAVQGLNNLQSNFPAVNQNLRQGRNTTAATNAPINTIMQNLNQIPVGGFGLGFGYPRSQQPNIGNFLNQGTPQPPTVTGYHWNAGTGGVSGGNNDWLRQYLSNGTVQSFTGGVPDNQPLAPTQYTLPGVNADVRALSDPSVGALEGAQRSSNRYGQNVINPTGGGQIISGKGPSFGSLQGSTPAADLQNRPGLNTPSGGQAFAGPSLRKPMDRMASGQNWSLGGWY